MDFSTAPFHLDSVACVGVKDRLAALTPAKGPRVPAMMLSFGHPH